MKQTVVMGTERTKVVWERKKGEELFRLRIYLKPYTTNEWEEFHYDDDTHPVQYKNDDELDAIVKECLEKGFTVLAQEEPDEKEETA